MRAEPIRAEEQKRLIQECRQSGLSDYQWCQEKGIKPNTFYMWIRRQRAKASLEQSNAKPDILPVKQDVVKVDIVPEKVASHQVGDGTETMAAIEVTLANAIVKIKNNADPQLVNRVLQILGC